MIMYVLEPWSRAFNDSATSLQDTSMVWFWSARRLGFASPLLGSSLFGCRGLVKPIKNPLRGRKVGKSTGGDFVRSARFGLAPRSR